MRLTRGRGTSAARAAPVGRHATYRCHEETAVCNGLSKMEIARAGSGVRSEVALSSKRVAGPSSAAMQQILHWHWWRDATSLRRLARRGYRASRREMDDQKFRAKSPKQNRGRRTSTRCAGDIRPASSTTYRNGIRLRPVPCTRMLQPRNAHRGEGVLAAIGTFLWGNLCQIEQYWL